MSSFIKIKLFDNIGHLPPEMKKFVKHISMFNAPLAMIHENIWRPPTDVYETKDKFIIQMEVAGTKKNDFKLTLTSNILTISGERPIAIISNEKLNNYTQMEIHYGHFEKNIFLPEEINIKKIKATYQNGFLKIILPKNRIKTTT